MDYKEMKPNAFKAFKNKNKRSDDDADFTGTIKLADGKEYWFNVRSKMSAKGDQYLSGWIGKEKQQSNFRPRGNDEMPRTQDSDIPF
jgi:hypothetical protein